MIATQLRISCDQMIMSSMLIAKVDSSLRERGMMKSTRLSESLMRGKKRMLFSPVAWSTMECLFRCLLSIICQIPYIEINTKGRHFHCSTHIFRIPKFIFGHRRLLRAIITVSMKSSQSAHSLQPGLISVESTILGLHEVYNQQKNNIESMKIFVLVHLDAGIRSMSLSFSILSS